MEWCYPVAKIRVLLMLPKPTPFAWLCCQSCVAQNWQPWCLMCLSYRLVLNPLASALHFSWSSRFSPACCDFLSCYPDLDSPLCSLPPSAVEQQWELRGQPGVFAKLVSEVKGQRLTWVLTPPLSMLLWSHCLSTQQVTIGLQEYPCLLDRWVFCIHV